MRDVSHQTTGARTLGLQSCTLSMLRRFAASISAERDRCCFREIDRRGLPCQADYRDDTDSSHNLPANSDVLQACYKEFFGTGNWACLDDSAFRHFYVTSVRSFLDQWDRDGDGIPEHYPEYRFRGLGSYNEGTQAKQALLGADLIALEYAAFQAYAETMECGGNHPEAKSYRDRAAALKERFSREWFDEDAGQCRSIMLQDRTLRWWIASGPGTARLPRGVVRRLPSGASSSA